MPNGPRTFHLVLVAAFVALGTAGLSAKESASTVTCTDGTTSKGGKGACSHHGGIAQGAAAAPSGVKIVSPEPDAAHVGTRVRCNDGSSSPHGVRGACSGHGGIDLIPANDNSGAKPSGTKPAKVTAPVSTPHSEPMNTPSAAMPGGATAKCKDGSLSNSKHHSGTCSGHGGVDQWLDGSK
jgi:hypothetical protein